MSIDTTKMLGVVYIKGNSTQIPTENIGATTVEPGYIIQLDADRSVITSDGQNSYGVSTPHIINNISQAIITKGRKVLVRAEPSLTGLDIGATMYATATGTVTSDSTGATWSVGRLYSTEYITGYSSVGDVATEVENCLYIDVDFNKLAEV